MKFIYRSLITYLYYATFGDTLNSLLYYDPNINKNDFNTKYYMVQIQSNALSVQQIT